MIQLIKGKRKYLFCADLKGSELLHDCVHQAMEAKVPFDLHIVEQESDSFLHLWLSQQKMGAFLYLCGNSEFANRVKKLAYDAGFSDEEMQISVCGPLKKRLICCSCYEVNEVAEEPQVTCARCGLELEVSDHYSRRLDATLGYVTIK